MFQVNLFTVLYDPNLYLQLERNSNSSLIAHFRYHVNVVFAKQEIQERKMAV